jgi:hypothetical protein
MKKKKAATGRTLGKEMVLEIESGRTRQQSLENSFWKRIRTSCKPEYVLLLLMIITLRSLFIAPMNLKITLSLFSFL